MEGIGKRGRQFGQKLEWNISWNITEHVGWKWCLPQAEGMEIWQLRIVNLCMGVSQDSNGFQTSLVSDYMQFCGLFLAHVLLRHLHVPIVCGRQWRKKKERSSCGCAFRRGVRGVAPHRCRVCPLNSARFITKINHRPEDFRGVQNLRFSISEFDVRSWRYSYPHWVAWSAHGLSIWSWASPVAESCWKTPWR